MLQNAHFVQHFVVLELNWDWSIYFFLAKAGNLYTLSEKPKLNVGQGLILIHPQNLFYIQFTDNSSRNMYLNTSVCLYEILFLRGGQRRGHLGIDHLHQGHTLQSLHTCSYFTIYYRDTSQNIHVLSWKKHYALQEILYQDQEIYNCYANFLGQPNHPGA